MNFPLLWIIIVTCHANIQQITPNVMVYINKSTYFCVSFALSNPNSKVPFLPNRSKYLYGQKCWQTLSVILVLYKDDPYVNVRFYRGFFAVGNLISQHASIFIGYLCRIVRTFSFPLHCEELTPGSFLEKSVRKERKKIHEKMGAKNRS